MAKIQHFSAIFFFCSQKKDDNREEIEGTIHSKEKLDFYMLAKYVWTV